MVAPPYLLMKQIMIAAIIIITDEETKNSSLRDVSFFTTNRLSVT
jgi:hypothetical protein